MSPTSTPPSSRSSAAIREDFRPGSLRLSREALIWAQARVLRAANRIEPRMDAVLDWYSKDPIDSLGGYTAESLVDAGLAERVLDFLCAIAPERLEQRIAA